MNINSMAQQNQPKARVLAYCWFIKSKYLQRHYAEPSAKCSLTYLDRTKDYISPTIYIGNIVVSLSCRKSFVQTTYLLPMREENFSQNVSSDTCDL